MTNNTPDYNENLYFEKTKTMTNLTELWKKGELPEGEYWVKYIYGDIEKLDYCLKTFNDNGYPINKETIEQVLAPVPSYEEFERLYNIATIASDGGISILRFIRNVNKENTQLKELLKECRKHLKIAEEDCGWDMQETITKIDEVLR